MKKEGEVAKKAQTLQMMDKQAGVSVRRCGLVHVCVPGTVHPNFAVSP